MRLCAIWLAILSLAAFGQTSPPSAIEMKACSQLHTAEACGVSQKELKNARQDFRAGMRLQDSGDLEKAFDAVAAAARLVPNDLEYVTVREVLRQQLVLQHLKAGNNLVLADKADKATAEFRQALALDPSNEFARQRLSQTMPPIPGNISNIAYADDDSELRLHPASGEHSYHYRGDTKGLFQAIGHDFGIAVEFDDSVSSRELRFYAGDLNFWRAVATASEMTKTFWAPISDRRMLVVADTRANRAQFERMSLRTFYLPDATTPQELNDVMNVMRTMFDIRQITHQPQSSSIVVRAPRRLLDAATEVVRSLDISRPQVMLDFQVLQVNRSMLKDMGLDMPLQWQAFTLTAAALAALNTPNVQDLINQLISSGGINQANSESIAALLQQQQSQQNSLFKNPVGTFGGGSTHFAVPFPPSTVHFSMNSSRVTTLQHMSLRAAHGTKATLTIGDKYPIVNGTFSPVFNTSAISQVLQNQSYQNPFPSFTFEDLGLVVTATPKIHQNDVTLDLKLEMKALTGTSLNGVPVISSRTYEGALSVGDGKTVIVAGSLDRSESDSVTGLPGIARIPLLNRAAAHYAPQETVGELLLMITPHIIRKPATTTGAVPVPAVD